MKTDFPAEETIRQYLLGRLNGQSDLEDRLSRQIFLDADLSEIVDSIEDEIIEEYLDGRASGADQKTIEEYFLRPPERKEKLRIARLLRQHLRATGETVTKKKLNAGSQADPELLVRGGASSVMHHWQSQLRTYCEIAACILLAALGIVYASHVSHSWQLQLEAIRRSQTQLEGELRREREHSDNLEQQLAEVHPPMVTLTFLGLTFRDQADTPVVQIKPWTQRIQVEIGLPGTSAGSYGVRLENQAHGTIWPQQEITASSGRLRFEVPTAGVSTGKYCLIVSSRPAPYCFQARVTKN